MTWDKPKNASQWLLLAAPPAICVLSTLAGELAEPKNLGWLAWEFIGLLIATAVSLALSIWLARVNPSLGDKVWCAVLCFLTFIVVDLTVCFAGCTVGLITFPHLNLH